MESVAAQNGRAWLLPIRKAAMARFGELGFPTTRHEEWRYTNVAPIASTPFKLAGRDTMHVSPERIKPFIFGGEQGHLLAFVNGRFAAKLSAIGALPDGVAVCALAEVLDRSGHLVERHLARLASFEEHAFTALNTAMMEDGAFVHIPKGVVVEEPIHLLFISAAPESAIVSHPRNLIVFGDSSQATIVETYAALDPGVYFNNAVTELVVGENAVVDHYKIVREADQAFHIGTLQLHQSRSSTVSSHAISLGGRLVRNDINAVLDGEGCECTLNGLYMVDGMRQVDNHLVVDHAKPHCDSREFFKGILDGKSRGTFSGRIIVRKDAQKTDAKQTNKSLLLSETAQVDSKPQLEILADDVKCTHGATIGQVSAEAIFYLRSRGISEAAARSMLVFAFAYESIEHVRVEALRAQLRKLLLESLPQRQLLQEVV